MFQPSEEKYSYSAIYKKCKTHDIQAFKYKTNNIFNWKEKCRQLIFPHGKQNTSNEKKKNSILGLKENFRKGCSFLFDC